MKLLKKLLIKRYDLFIKALKNLWAVIYASRMRVMVTILIAQKTVTSKQNGRSRS